MARIQLGSIVTGITGKLGGHIFGNSLNGPTIRNKNNAKKLWGYIHRGSTGGGQSPQGNVSLISQSWKDLSVNQRAAWTSYAVQYYTTHSLYGPHSLTGYGCYSKLNHNLLLIGVAIITDPVPKVTLTDPGVLGISVLSATQFKVTYTNSLAPNEFFLISATGTNTVTLLVQKKGFKIIKSVDSSAASPIDIFSEYYALKGSPLPGGWITVKIEVINALTGQRGNAKSVARLVV